MICPDSLNRFRFSGFRSPHSNLNAAAQKKPRSKLPPFHSGSTRGEARTTETKAVMIRILAGGNALKSWDLTRHPSSVSLSKGLEDSDRLSRVGAHRVVWIGARVADEAVRVDDEPARNRELPGVVAVESLKVYSILAVQFTQIIRQRKD